ncbi:MAG: T9SS type A sorting domain-containing protein, partial [Bacteroidales bacterium]|nr:T9SS type A sorting domain-containing protein [Bacteroidales bacterium]
RISNSKKVPAQKIRVFINNVYKGKVRVPRTKINQWRDIIIPGINIKESQHLTIKLEFVAGGFDLNSFQVLKKDLTTPFAIYDDGSQPIIKNTIVTSNKSIQLDLYNSGTVVKIDIFDVNGKKLMEEFVYGEVLVDFNLNNELIPGTYIMRFDDGISIKNEKFVVK